MDVDERGGFAFVRDPALMHGTFALTGAPYLPEVSARAPELRRPRAGSVAAGAHPRRLGHPQGAYGRAGY